MKKTILFLVLFGSQAAFAGSVAGTGGASEVTQMRNEVQLVLQYEQAVQSYLRQGLQLQNELTNLIKNPASLLGADIGEIINGVGSIMSAGKSIGGRMEQIDKNFATMFKSPTADTLARSFTKWNSTSTDTLQSAMKAAGMHRDSTQSDTDNLTALYNESQATQGNLQAVQTLSKINAMQVQQLQKLQDLLATQNIAMNTYLASQTAKEKAKIDKSDTIMGSGDLPLPKSNIGGL